MYNCIFFKSVSKIDKITECSKICSNCNIIERYRKLANLNKIDIIKDMASANFTEDKHRNNKKEE